MKPAWMRWALALLFLVSPLGAGAAQAPAIEAAREGLTLSRLPAVLAEGEVRKQLATGLTTSFVFETTARDARGVKTKGGARIDVRYELWDEVYIVTRIDASGRAQKTTLPSFEKLGEWWREARLVVIRPPAAGRAAGVQVRLRVIPFSQAEQLDAQRWFSQALSAERSGSAGALSEAVEDQPESLNQVLGLLMATSIGRAALLEYQWNLPLSAGKAGKKK
jgi:hypothetical protein